MLSYCLTSLEHYLDGFEDCFDGDFSKYCYGKVIFQNYGLIGSQFNWLIWSENCDFLFVTFESSWFKRKIGIEGTVWWRFWWHFKVLILFFRDVCSTFLILKIGTLGFWWYFWWRGWCFESRFLLIEDWLWDRCIFFG